MKLLGRSESMARLERFWHFGDWLVNLFICYCMFGWQRL